MEDEDDVYLADLPEVVHAPPTLPLLDRLVVDDRIQQFDETLSGLFRDMGTGINLHGITSSSDPKIGALRMFGAGMTIEQLRMVRDEVDALIEQKSTQADNA